MRPIANRIGMMRRRLCMTISGMALAAALPGGVLAQAPTVEAMPGKPSLPYGSYSIESLGYAMQEYAVSGIATSYRSAGLDDSGTISTAETAPYKTRIVLIRPADPKRFNGTVLVEWLNVTGGLDVPVDWTSLHRELVRSGFAYVGVTAQKVGIDGGGLGMGGPNARALKAADPARYGSLSHPGDAYSFDIYSQIGRFLKSRNGAALFGSVPISRAIAIGQSQSAFFMTTYVNDIDPIAKVYDGIIIHSRGGSAVGLSGHIDPVEVAKAPPMRLRANLRVPVMQIVTETDLMTLAGGFYGARQPDNGHLRTWEVAGASHADNYLFLAGQIDTGRESIDKLTALLEPTKSLAPGMTAPDFINDGPQHHYIAEAALRAMDRWLKTGKAPSAAEPMKVDAGPPPSLMRDADGLALGGIRSPWVDAPVALISGVSPATSLQASLFGFTKPFDAEKLNSLYPAGRQEYLAKFSTSLDNAIKDGFILADDRQEIMALATAGYKGKP
jgi:hypothetical protein